MNQHPSYEGEKLMRKVSLIIPVYNEISHLEEVLKIIDNLQLGIEKELVLVDDASKDGSSDLIRNLKLKTPTITWFQTENQGKGAALKKGIELATGDIIGIQDADFEYSVKDVPSVLALLLNGDADVVYGSRFKKSGTQVHRTFHYLVNRILTTMSNFSSGLYLTDMETCYKFFKAEIIKPMILETSRFGFEPEVTAKIGKLKVRVHEVPISYFPRNYMEGKKITWKDGVAAIFHIIHFNYFRSLTQSFRKELPARYIPGGQNWL